MALRDGYSGFGYFDALTPIHNWANADATGPTIDTVGYETVTFALCTGDVSVSLNFGYRLRMQHASASAAGNDGVWSFVSNGDILGSEFSLYTAFGLNSGTVFSMAAVIDHLSSPDFESAVFMVGYRGKRRYVRMVHSALAGWSGAGANSCTFGVTAILGLPANWPVNTVL